jgi:uncharacterized repeat protein (TIGR01451 family)
VIQRRRFTGFFRRALAAQFACVLALFAGVGAADAAILVNKAFSPTSVALGGVSTVTITLQNTSTLTAANVTAFSDDIATMAGTATIASPSGLATTCSGGNPSITGTVVSMSAGVIPIAPSTTVSGTCTITLNVVGAIVGNGVNTIAQGALVTDQGSNGTSASQTLQVTGLAPAVTPSGTTTVTTASTATNTFTIANPNGAALTNVTIPITAAGNSAFTITGVTLSGPGCSGTETFPPGAVTTGTASISIPSFPAYTSCVVTITTTTVSQTAANNVTYTSASTSITDDQGVTNSGAKTSVASFITGRPTVAKSFTPNVVSDSGTTTLTIKIPNIETQALTTVGLTDGLPAYLTVDAAPNFTTTNCGAMTNTSISGSGTVSVAGGTVAAATTLGTASAASTCTITILLDVSPTAPSIIETNTIPSANLTDDQNLPGATNAQANITITSTGVSDTKAFTTSPVARLTPDRLTLTFTNATGTALTAGSFVDNLPQTPVAMTVDPSTTPTPIYAGCGTPSAAYSSGNTVVTVNTITIAAHSTCTVYFNVLLAGASGTDTNTVLASNVSFTSGASTINAGQNVSANVTAQSAFTAVNYVAAAGGLENQPLTVQASITLRAAAGVTDTNVVATFVLNANATPHSVALAPNPNFTYGGGCPTGTLAATSTVYNGFGEAFTVTAPSLSATCTITYNVINEQTGAAGKGTFAPGSSTYTSTENVVTTTTGATNNVTFYNTSINVNKTFSPIAIVAGSTSTASITLSVKPVSGLATTLATGVGFVDSLPTNLVFATPPNVTFSAGCQQTGQATPSGVISGTQITVTNVSLIAVGTTATNCVVSFDTTSTALGNVTNTLPVGAITSPTVLLASASNTQAASASLSVTAGVSLLKTFVNPTLQIGSTNAIRFLITNSASSSTLSSGTLTDVMPSSLALASLTVPANQAGDPPACGGTITGTVGASTFHVSGMTVLGTTGGVASQCVQYVLVTTTSTAAPGVVSNTISAGALTIGGYSNTTGTTGTTTDTPPPGPTITKAFATPSILVNGTSVLTITIANTAVGAAPLTAMALTDTLPTNVAIAATPNASTTCPSGAVTAVAASGSVAITGATLAAGASCTITVSVTSATPGNYTNTIPASALTTTQGATNAAPATATLAVTAPPVTVSKVFTPSTITIGGVSVLTVSIANTATGSLPLTGLALTDTLPANVTIAATPAASTTCGAGTVAATAGGSSVALSAGTLASGATCTITVSVTSNVAGPYTNTIPASAVTSNEGASNTAPATAVLTVNNAPPVVVTKAFSPASIISGGTSTLTVTIANTNASAVALTALALTDTLPTGVTVAATPAAATTCPSGTAAATAGGTTLALTGGTLAAGASCTMSVSVTSSVPNAYLNTIPIGAVTTTQGASNTAAATATLTVTASNVTLSKSFTPATINPGGTSVLTLTIANTATGAGALTGLALTDGLPAGVTIAATPATSTTCGAGTVTATAGGTSVALSAGTLGAGATCTVSVSVTGTLPGGYLNTIPIGALTSTQGASNAAPASATLTIVNAPPVVISKAFAPASIISGGTSTLTVTIANTNASAVALTALALSDSLPTGVTVAATPAAATTCPLGTAAATAGGTTLALTGGSLAAGASCTMSVSVTATIPNAYVNTIPIGAVTTTQGASNTAAATATLTVTASSVTIGKAFAPATINPGGTSLLTLTIANTATGAAALTGVAVTDSLPIGVTIAATPNASTTCGVGTVTATAGGTSVALSAGTLAAGATCTVTVSVTGTLPGGYTNIIPIGGLTSTQGASNTTAASATLTIANAPPVSIAKSFTPASIAVGGISQLTVTIANTATGAVALSNVHLQDLFPTGVTLAPTPALATTCPSGTVTQVAGPNPNVTLSGATIAAGATCTITANVTSSTVGAALNTIPASALTSTQGATNTAPASATLTVAAPSVALSKAFAPATIVRGGVSALTITIANTATGAIALTNVSVTDGLPTGVTIAAAPNASTTCPAGTVNAVAGAASVSLTGGTLAAAASCTIVVNVTGTLPNTYTNTIPVGAVTTNEGASNGAAAVATLTIVNAPAVTLTKAFAPATISINGVSQLTISIANTATGAVALTAVAVTDALPTGVTVAATPNASTTCGAGTVTGAAGATSIALANGTLAAGATCTVTISVTSSMTGGYVNTIPAGAVTSAQGGTNAAQAQATLTVVSATLSVTKTSTPANANVSPGQRITYTVTIVNSGTGPESNATITDTLTNATLVPGSVTVNGVAAADTVVTSGTSFGAIAAGATATIVYAATVNSAATPGTSVTNSVVAGGAQPCTGPSCSASSGANLVTAPVLTLVKTINGVTSVGVVNGETVSYGLSLSNTGTVPAQNVVVTDPFPAGATPIAGSITVNGVTATNATIVGQTVTIPIGTVAAGQSIPITIGATIATTGQPVVNVANAAATGLGTSSVSNAATASVGSGQLIVSKTSDASVVQVGDRVTYTIVVRAPGGVAYGVTTIVDTLPAYEAYAPGTARINGKANEPVVSGRVLTWTVPSLTAPLTITYAVAIVPGAPQNGSLTNVVNVRAVGPGGGSAGTGTASSTITVIASTFGACYPITGRVYLDTMKTGSFVDGDTGLGSVRVYLDDGESVETDAQGRYNFPCVRPGMHALRLDASTLPNGAVPYDDRRLDSERSTRRLVHRTFDTTIIEDINFAIRDTSVP